MKSRFLIGLSAIALLILIFVQSIFITETYSTKQEQFDSRFGSMVRKAMLIFHNQDYNFGFDSVLYLLDNMALDYLYADADTITQTIPQAFYKVLSDYREAGTFLTDYVRKSGEEPAFTYHLQIDELALLDMQYEKQVYPDSIQLPEAPPEALQAGSYTEERNFFRITYGIYINFTNRSQLIIKEMRLVLSLSILTLILVFTVFFMTLRNMLKQLRLSDMKTDFINNMTHELKTPLSTISVASSSLGRSSVMQDENQVEELSGIIKRQNRHLSELIDRILDINIWEKDQVKLKPEQVAVEDWIRGILYVFDLEKGKESAEISLSVNLHSPTFYFDKVHMSNAINNLLSNSVKYGFPPCKIGIELKEDKGKLVLSLWDNGPGIKKEDLKHIFEKFYRGFEPKQRVIKGLGLGLYYVKQIVEAHGGTIHVSSTPGKGTRFTIQIPTEDASITG